jgi:hypothetical protein
MILRVREIGDTSDDGAIWPVPSCDQDLLVELEEWDGGQDRLRWMTVTGLLEQEVQPGGAKTVNRLTKVNGSAYVTDARFTGPYGWSARQGPEVRSGSTG